MTFTLSPSLFKTISYTNSEMEAAIAASLARKRDHTDQELEAAIAAASRVVDGYEDLDFVDDGRATPPECSCRPGHPCPVCPPSGWAGSGYGGGPPPVGIPLAQPVDITALLDRIRHLETRATAAETHAAALEADNYQLKG